MGKAFRIITLTLVIASGPAIASPMIYTFSGNAGVLVDDLGLVASAGIFPTGHVQYRFLVDTSRPSITRDWTGATFELNGTANDRRFYATLVSRPYLITGTSQEYFLSGESGQSLNSSGLIAGGIGVEFSGNPGSPHFGDSYNITIAVSSFSDSDVLFENWSIGELFGGVESYRAFNGTRSAFSAALQLESVDPYSVPEPGSFSLLATAALVFFARGSRRSYFETESSRSGSRV